MKLLITTQVIDKKDPVLGFFHRWVEEFAKNCEQVTVICLKAGEYTFPDNVRVLSLGKERGTSRLTRILKFYGYIWRERHNYTAIFAHMNPEYVILGGVPWRLLGKRVGLWYAHKSVTTKLKIGASLAHIVFTSSPEGFRLKSPKVSIVGQGIDPAFFKTHVPHRDTLRLITIGRIAPSKRLGDMLAAMESLYSQGKRFEFQIVGAPITKADEKYFAELQQSLKDKPYRTFIQWRGPVSHNDLPALLAESDIFLNLSATGSMDKAVLEALASGLAVLSNNEAFRRMLEPHGLFLFSNDPDLLAEAILNVSKINIPSLAPMVKERHSLERLAPAIVRQLER